jgi:hypothetical protein
MRATELLANLFFLLPKGDYSRLEKYHIGILPLLHSGDTITAG